VSERVEMSREGLRILRTEGEIVLKDWEKGAGQPDLNRASDLRQAVREASKRLEEVDAVQRERDKE
jgi:hypothetical protein